MDSYLDLMPYKLQSEVNTSQSTEIIMKDAIILTVMAKSTALGTGSTFYSNSNLRNNVLYRIYAGWTCHGTPLNTTKLTENNERETCFVFVY